MSAITMDSIVVWSNIPVAAEVGEEVVLMHLPRGRCYGLGPVGTDLWKKIGQPVRVRQLVDSLLTEYVADRSVIEADVIETLQQYAGEGLIVVREGESDFASAGSS